MFERIKTLIIIIIIFEWVIYKVGNRPVNMHIDQTSGHYWSIEKKVDVKIISISYPNLLHLYIFMSTSL